MTPSQSRTLDEHLLLRKATQDDCKSLFLWRNDPETRAASLSTAVIAYEDHVQWFTSSLNNSDRNIWIAENQAKEVLGQVRFDKEEAYAEVHISLAPEQRGKGYGKKILALACSKYLDQHKTIKTIKATIKENNIASIKIFEKVGFKITECKNTILHLERKRLQLGLKLWSTNDDLFAEATQLVKDGAFDFIELYTVPGSFDEKKLAVLNAVKVNIHGPHDAHDFDLMHDRERNAELFKETLRFADFLESDYIVVHPGVGDDFENLKKNVEAIKDQRLLLENMPCDAIGGGTCFGYKTQDIKAMLGLSVGFCLDFGHAIKAAGSQGIDYKTYLQELIALQPFNCHISGGFAGKGTDEHLDLKDGNFDLAFVKQLLLEHGCPRLVFETPKRDGLQNDIKNKEFFEQL